MPALQISNLRKVYGTGEHRHEAIRDISITVDKGEFVSIVGPSGAGKTTLLLCTAGLMAASGGEVRIDGVVIDRPPANMAVVFQDYSRSLFPWLTVTQNVDLPLKDRKLAPAERAARVEEAIAAVGLTSATARYPWQLSGGMQQRVAIARALAVTPDVLLMDEPFASVDAQTRTELEDLLLSVWRRYGMTVLFITHDIEEAVYLSDRVVVLSRPPSTVATELAVPLARPRDQIVTKEDPVYAHLRSAVLSEVMPRASRSTTSDVASD